MLHIRIQHDSATFERGRSLPIVKSRSSHVTRSVLHGSSNPCKIGNYMVMISRIPMPCVHGSGRSSHENRCRYFRLQRRGMRQQGFPVRDVSSLRHLAALSRAVRRSLRNSEAKARAFGSRLPRVRARSFTRRAMRPVSSSFITCTSLRQVPMLPRVIMSSMAALVSSRPAVFERCRSDPIKRTVVSVGSKGVC
jgi:hypothetical protein